MSVIVPVICTYIHGENTNLYHESHCPSDMYLLAWKHQGTPRTAISQQHPIAWHRASVIPTGPQFFLWDTSNLHTPRHRYNTNR